MSGRGEAFAHAGARLHPKPPPTQGNEDGSGQNPTRVRPSCAESVPMQRAR